MAEQLKAAGAVLKPARIRSARKVEVTQEEIVDDKKKGNISLAVLAG
jgi:hypothetical protein